jgi:hypothetical protein
MAADLPNPGSCSNADCRPLVSLVWSRRQAETELRKAWIDFFAVCQYFKTLVFGYSSSNRVSRNLHWKGKFPEPARCTFKQTIVSSRPPKDACFRHLSDSMLQVLRIHESSSSSHKAVLMHDAVDYGVAELELMNGEIWGLGLAL